VNTIDGLTEEQATEIVSSAEILAEEQTDDLPRRKGGRAAAALLEAPSETETEINNEEPLPDEGESPQAEEATEAEDIEEASLAPEDLADHPHGELPTHSSDIPGDSTGARDSALPAERNSAVGDDLPTDDSPDSEGDEASDDEIHDLALAVETSGLSPQGHEVTSKPNDDDQGETIRIVTEAVENGGPVRPSAPAAPPAGATTQPARPAAVHSPSATENRGSQEESPQDGDES
jgi:transcription termination/antitermination protein NusA